MPDVLADPDPTVPFGKWRLGSGVLVDLSRIPMEYREFLLSRRVSVSPVPSGHKVSMQGVTSPLSPFSSKILTSPPSWAS